MRKTPNDMPMVKYWKHSEVVTAAITTDENGALVMKMDGEDEVFPGFPRNYSLYGTLSKLKHEIKNQIFNEAWALLENKVPEEDVVAHIKRKATGELQQYIDAVKYDRVPDNKLFGPVKELNRAFSVLEKKHKRVRWLKDTLIFIMQEDDAYRFRMQWLVSIFNPSSWWFKIMFRDPVSDFQIALEELENAEIIGDMKERIRLLRRILMVFLQDKNANALFKAFCKEVDWNKIKLSRADKYHFRAKWFKVDWDRFEY